MTRTYIAILIAYHTTGMTHIKDWRMQWIASTLHTTSEHGVSSITTADAAHLYCQQSTELTPTGRFKWTGEWSG